MATSTTTACRLEDRVRMPKLSLPTPPSSPPSRIRSCFCRLAGRKRQRDRRMDTLFAQVTTTAIRRRTSSSLIAHASPVSVLWSLTNASCTAESLAINAGHLVTLNTGDKKMSKIRQSYELQAFVQKPGSINRQSMDLKSLKKCPQSLPSSTTTHCSNCRPDGTKDPYASVRYLVDELGTSLRPLHYDIHLILPGINTSNETFEGYVKICVVALQKTTVLAIHVDPDFGNIRAVFAQLVPSTIRNCFNRRIYRHRHCLFGRRRIRELREAAFLSWTQISSNKWHQGLGVESHVVEFDLPYTLYPDDCCNMLLVFEAKLGDACRLCEPIRWWDSSSESLETQLSRVKDQTILNKSGKECFNWLNSAMLTSSTLYQDPRKYSSTIRTVSTSLEPMYARRMFPCFDSIQFKATFSLAVSFPDETPPIPTVPGISVISSGVVASQYLSPMPPFFNAFCDILPLQRGKVTLQCIDALKYDERPIAEQSTRKCSVGGFISIRRWSTATSNVFQSVKLEPHKLISQRTSFLDDLFASEHFWLTFDPQKYPLQHTFVFEKTPVIPCYALGLTIGHFNRITEYVTFHQPIESRAKACKEKNVFRTKISTPQANITLQPLSELTPPQQIAVTACYLPGGTSESCRFSLWIACCCLKFLGARWYRVPYPLSKLDLIALPSHRGLGLENFGSVTFDSRYFFVNSSTHRRRALRIARLVCHQVSHMWFGDLLSPLSFDSVWFKEGIARYIEYCVLQYVFPFPCRLVLPCSSESFEPFSKNENRDKNYNDEVSANPVESTYLRQMWGIFNFSENDLLSSFGLEVFWDALVADAGVIHLPFRVTARNYLSLVDSENIDRTYQNHMYGIVQARCLGSVSSNGLTFSGENSFKQLAVPSTIALAFQPLRPILCPSPSPRICIREFLKQRHITLSNNPMNNTDSEDHTTGTATHPMEFQGLLTTNDVISNFDSISYGKAACILHSIATALGGTEVFFEVLHVLLQNRCLRSKYASLSKTYRRSKGFLKRCRHYTRRTKGRSSLLPVLQGYSVGLLMDKQLGIMSKKDMWEAAVQVSQDPHLVRDRNMPFNLGIDEALLTNPLHLESLFDPFITLGGFPRIAVLLDKPKLCLALPPSFSVGLHIYQLPPPDLYFASAQASQTTASSGRKRSQLLTTANDSTRQSLNYARPNAANVYNDCDPIYSFAPFRFPLSYWIDGKPYNILVGETPRVINIQQNLEGPPPYVESDVQLSLVLNGTFSSFCTVHPQNEATWLALFRGIKNPQAETGDRDVTVALITILEDVRYRLGVFSTLHKQQKSTAVQLGLEGRKLLGEALTKLCYLYTAIAIRLYPVPRSRQQSVLSFNTRVVDACVSLSCLTVLHLVLDVLDWMLRVASKRPGMTRAHLDAMAMCEQYMEAELLHPRVLLTCQRHIASNSDEHRSNVGSATVDARHHCNDTGEVDEPMTPQNSPFHRSLTPDLRSHWISINPAAFHPVASWTLHPDLEDSGSLTGDFLLKKPDISDVGMLYADSSSKDDVSAFSTAAASTRNSMGYISGERILRELRKLQLTPPKSLKNTRFIMALLLDIASLNA